jgi:flavin reductase (DIM6/NTAB) family NADH-FMN oxidoreductase RutF
VLGHFPTGVTIVTGIGPAGPSGLTIGSFTSVSLDPPLVGFFPSLQSDTWPSIAPSGAFCVNVLAADQGDLCWRFARDADDDRFSGVAWRPGPTGSPILEGALAWIDCTVDQEYTMGDHLCVLGTVVALDAAAGTDPEPLLFFRGKLGSFAPS